MRILNTPINKTSFNDVVQFCQEKHIEGIQLDYKREIPRGLAKHLAAFSNTRGGLIIIGVEEDAKGLPGKWEGIDNNGKIIDRVHQYAANVTPLPRYSVAITDEQNGKVFCLVRVFEGEQTPYYVQNDANIWVRTGNVSSLIGQGTPDALELLFRKKDKAYEARQYYVARTKEVFKAALQRGERERKQAKADEQDQGGSFVTDTELGTNAAMFSILLQPYYPQAALTTPKDLKQLLQQDVRVSAGGWGGGDFPTLELEAMPEGVMSFGWGRHSGVISNGQFYASGVIFRSDDVLFIDRENGNSRTIHLCHIAAYLYQTLKFAQSLYQRLGYQGGLEGSLTLESAAECLIRPVTAQRFSMESFLPRYDWQLSTDTVALSSDQQLLKYLADKCAEIHWSFGYEEQPQRVLFQFLSKCGFIKLDEQGQPAFS